MATLRELLSEVSTADRVIGGAAVVVSGAAVAVAGAEAGAEAALALGGAVVGLPLIVTAIARTAWHNAVGDPESVAEVAARRRTAAASSAHRSRDGAR